MMNELLTFSGQILILVGALMGAGGGLRYFLEPVLKRRHLRKVMATGVWLSCYELRRHLEEIKSRLTAESKSADGTRDALMKIPRHDFKGRPDWFVKWGYFSMITAYKIAAFSSWMRIYQTAVLQALLTRNGSTFISELFQKFDSYKVLETIESTQELRPSDSACSRLHLPRELAVTVEARLTDVLQIVHKTFSVRDGSAPAILAINRLIYRNAAARCVTRVTSEVPSAGVNGTSP